MNSINNSFEIELSKIQPSQLYISKQKLAKVKEKFNPKDLTTLEVIPIKEIEKKIIYIDGHTRAFAAYQAGYKKIPVVWEDEELDWEIYKICVKWCKADGIYSIDDLRYRVVNQKDYEILWYKRCDELHKKLTIKRAKKMQ